MEDDIGLEPKPFQAALISNQAPTPVEIIIHLIHY